MLRALNPAPITRYKTHATITFISCKQADNNDGVKQTHRQTWKIKGMFLW